jgi:hypothetical protein
MCKNCFSEVPVIVKGSDKNWCKFYSVNALCAGIVLKSRLDGCLVDWWID